MLQTFRRAAALCLCWLAVVAILLALGAATYQRWSSQWFPFSVIFSYVLKNPSGMIEFQYSKRSVIPENYIAIFGDSYAFGQGDGLHALQQQRRPAFNVTHILHAHTGRDVVSFGVPSSGSIKAYITDPAAAMAYPGSLSGKALPDPALLVLYFYEGNDIEENVIDAARVMGVSPVDYAALRQVSLSQEDFERRFLSQDPQDPQDPRDALPAAGFLAQIYRFLSFLQHTVAFVSGRDELAQDFAALPNEPRSTGTINQVLMQGKVTTFYDGLQGPSMLLDDEQTAIGFELLERTLAYLHRRYPDVPMVMVHIPAPATIYRLASAEVDLWDMLGVSSGPVRLLSSRVRPRSNFFCERAMALADKYGIYYHDARPALATAGATRMIHGPVDMHHFNLDGYAVLAAEVIRAVNAISADDIASLLPCASLSQDSP